MWESKDNCIDVNYNTEHVWFEGINGQHIQKPADIRKWEESKCHKLIEKHFPRVKADKMLADLSSIALEWAKNYVRQRQTFKLNTKGENMAPLAFQHDPDGTYHDLAVQLRNVDVSLAREDDGPSFEPMEDGEELKETSAESKTPAVPTREKKSLTASARAGITSASRVRMPSPEREGEKMFRKQKELLSLWIDDPDHIAEETCRYALELYIQLNDSEFAYVTELQVIYDETRCFFLQWLLGKEIKELVNSARISAVQSGKPFTWIHARAEVLKSLTDVTLTARFLALSRLKRAQGTTAKLWISQVLTKKALLEDPKLPAPIHLPECLYLEILVGQMSAQETTVFEHCPAIGDDLLQKTVLGQRKFTLDKLKRSIDACSNPPYFRGVSTPITDLLDAAEPKVTKQKRDQTKDKAGKTKDGKHNTNSATSKGDPKNSHLSRRPEHEQPSKLPAGLKRPDLDAVVDGHKIASEFQRQLYDDVKRGNCTRCHKGGHNRTDCKEPKAKWEDKFDKEKTQYWASALKWQQKATQHKGSSKVTVKDAHPLTHPPTLHTKPEQRFNVLSTMDSDTDDDSMPLYHYRMVMDDPHDDDDDHEEPEPIDVAIPQAAPTTPPLTVAEILADVDRRLATYPVEISPTIHAVDDDAMTNEDDIEMTDEDAAHIARMDAHVRSILAGADSRLFVLNTALGHTPPPPPITDDELTKHIEEVYAYYYADTSSDDDIDALIAEGRNAHRPPTPYYVPASPVSPSPTRGTPHDDITYAMSTTSISSSRPSVPMPILPTFPDVSSSSSVVIPASASARDARESSCEPSPMHPRKLQKLDSTATTRAARPHIHTAGISAPWGDAPLHAEPAPVGQWQMFQWGNAGPHGPDPEPEPWASWPPYASPDSHPDEDDFPLSSYVQTRSSFQGGTTVNATGFVRDPTNLQHPLSTRPLLIGLDSYSDVTVAHRSIVYNVRPIHESLSTGGGSTDYHEEGLVDIVDGPCSFRTIPALVASDPSHLPAKCLLLMGVPQLNELNIKLDTHRKARRLPLESYDPSIDFSADTDLQCHMSEKDLLTWAEHHAETPVGYTLYSHLDVVYGVDTLAPDEIDQLRAASAKYKKVYDAAKDALPALANHPPVKLNFKEGWKHVSVPVPRWGPGATAILTRWAKAMLASGLYTRSKSPSASRPHIVRKPPPNAPKDVDIRQCGIRVCGDYRMPNDQLQKSFPTTANGTDELSKLPGYSLYWWTDRFSMYNAYSLEPGPSRELLAVHTPLGLIEPTRMVFGEMNAGTVACAATPAILRTLPDSAHLRTAAYVDDHAQGSHSFAELLKGYTDFLALCERENWTLNATKTFVGFSSCVFFGFHVDKSGTRLADKNLDPIKRMVPPANLPELRMTLGVFVQSSRFIPRYAHIVRPLTELTRSDKGKPVPYLWTPERQQSYDHIRNLLLDGIHLAPPDYRLPFHSGGDASNDGKSYGIHQFCDLPRSTQFSVTAHTPTETTVRLTDTNTLHTIPHNNDTRHNIAWFSKTWSEADRKRAPFYLEADTLLWGLAKCRFWALSSPFPLYASSDHLPLKWVRKCDKGPVSEFTIEQLSDIQWIHSYVPGPENSLFDALSRYPLLGPRVLAPVGLSDAVANLLDSLPDYLQDAHTVRVFAPPHTQKVAQQVQAWRRPTNPIDVHSLTHRSAPHPDTGLIITVPRAEDAPRITARLLTTNIPFAALLPSDLAPRTTDDRQFEDQPDLRDAYKNAGKIMYLDSDQLWIIGNIPTLHNFHHIYSQVLHRPAPLLEIFSNTLHPNLPTTMTDWKNAQDNEPDFFKTMDPASLALCNGLTVYKDDDFPSRIVVPPSLRTHLIRQHHTDLQHVSHSKVLTSLARYYYWPTMKMDVRRACEDCELCENEKGKRRLAHGLFASDTTAKPRSRYSMDFQGQGLATSGESEALALIDSFTKTVILIPLPDRQAPTLVPRLLDELHFRRGSPDVLHSDDAPEFLSELLAIIATITGTHRTSTCGHNPQSNGEIESWWRFWNRAMRYLSPSQYLVWPTYAQRICFAYNSVPHDSIAQLSPFEMDFGAPPKSPFGPPDPALQIVDLEDPPDFDPAAPVSPEELAAALRVSVQAFHALALAHKQFLATTTEERLNKHGIPKTFAINDRVKIYVPPTHAQILRTGRKSNHIVAWRGPCTITRILSPSAYEMTEDCSGRTFQRTIINIRPFRATKTPPPPHHDLVSSAALLPSTIIAVRDTPDSAFHLAKVLHLTETLLSIHYLGTTSRPLDTAVFRLVWIAPDGRTVLKDTRPARNHSPVTGEIDAADLPDLLVASHLLLTSSGRLSRKSSRLLFHLRDQLHIY